MTNLAIELNYNFVRMLQRFKQQNISVVMPTYAPQRGEILQEFSAAGVDTLISGGFKGAQCFKTVEQVGIDADTLSGTILFPQAMTKAIVEAIPKPRLEGRKVAVFSYINSLGWSEYIKARNLNTEIVATVEQDLRKYFEEKGNLGYILQKAGLEAYVIPHQNVDDKTPLPQLQKIYHQLKNSAGKVVVQDIRTEMCHLGGKGTVFIDNFADFSKHILQNSGAKKVSRFINGVESNLSFFAGNSEPSKDSLGAQKRNLNGQDPLNPATLDALLKNGIAEQKTVCLSGRATLKAVGDELLINNEASGVGNDIGYIYPKQIQQQIKEIGNKLSSLMARCGKVGLAGADLIIDADGKVYVNEINDRQQGPTAQMSKDAQKASLPSLTKLALLSCFGDLKDQKIQSLLQGIKEQSASLTDSYMNTPAEFYIKIHATHSKKDEVAIQRNIRPGYYDVIKNEQGKFEFNFASYRHLDKDIAYQSNPNRPVMTLKVEGGQFQKGDTPGSGSQLFRVCGVADNENRPFVIRDGKTVLNNSWKPVVKAFYNYLFDDKYFLKNPLYQKRNAEKNQILGSIIQNLRSK